MTSERDYDNEPDRAKPVYLAAGTARGKGVGFVIPKLIAFDGDIAVYDRGREILRIPPKGEGA